MAIYHFKKFLVAVLFIACAQLSIASSKFTFPHGLKVELISSSQVKVSWEGSINDQNYELRRREAGSNFWTYCTVSAPTTNKRFTGLKAATTYEWEVQAYGKSNKDGSGFVAGTKFITFSNCELPGDYTFQSSGLTSATISWAYGQNVEKYEVRLKASGDENWKSYFTEYSSLSLNDLLPYTEYEWQISTYCTATTLAGSQFSPSQYFYTQSYLQTGISQVVINHPTVENKTEEIISSNRTIEPAKNYVKMINTMGQTVQQYPISYVNSSGDVYFDMNGQPPAGVYFIQVPVEMNSSGQKILVK